MERVGRSEAGMEGSVEERRSRRSWGAERVDASIKAKGGEEREEERRDQRNWTTNSARAREEGKPKD